LWAGGWLHTGDIAVIGTDGYVKITDRFKDVIKSGGEWVSSLDVEDLLLRHTGVAEAAVIGIPDPKWSERPMAIVVLRNGVAATASDMRTHLKDYVAKGIISGYALPEKVLFVEELPRTSVGKIDKKELRRKFVA
jgi:fatty-acyl-CoA synthase